MIARRELWALAVQRLVSEARATAGDATFIHGQRPGKGGLRREGRCSERVREGGWAWSCCSAAGAAQKLHDE